jgi:hypothetical protein
MIMRTSNVKIELALDGWEFISGKASRNETSQRDGDGILLQPRLEPSAGPRLQTTSIPVSRADAVSHHI